MKSPFDAVKPADAGVDVTPHVEEDNKISSSTTESIEEKLERVDKLLQRNEDATSMIVGALFNDDGTVRDIAQTSLIWEICHSMERAVHESVNMAKSNVEDLKARIAVIPTSVQAELCEADRTSLQEILKTRNAIFKDYIMWIAGFILICVLSLCSGILMLSIAQDKQTALEAKANYYQQWYDDNAEKMAMGQFIYEQYPNAYKEWRSGKWARDVAYRDSIKEAHSLRAFKQSGHKH